jgi:hypothetical protein
VLFELLQELRELVPAGDAGRTPEVDDDRSTPVRREIERLVVERPTDDRWGWLADGGVRPKVVAVDVPPDAGRGQDRDRDGDDDGSTGRADVPWDSRPYWRVAVPVMLGWTVQAKP